MSLEQMNLLEREAQREEGIANEALKAQALLADVRKGDRSLSDALVDLLGRWNYGANEIARNELYTAINRFSHDILRVAEMTLSARARAHKVTAKQKRAIIKASILALTEDTQELNHDNQ